MTEKTVPAAEILLDSISPDGHRLTTMKVDFHRFVLAEFNTHRVFSRSSASSRAIPVAKQLDRILNDPALPLYYAYNQAGMQAADRMSPEDAAAAESIILELRDAALRAVEKLAQLGPINPETGNPLGLHKQWANRYLEPWMWHTVIVTSTEWENFFNQRCSPLAQPEIEAPAQAMREAFEASIPTLIEYGDWHTPLILDDERDEDSPLFLPTEKRCQVSCARCARVSYLTFDGTRDHSKDFELWDRLVDAFPPHASPLEHVATPQLPGVQVALGNFYGWDQLRHKVLDEDYSG